MESKEYIEKGETIRLEAQFYDFGNNLYDPDTVKVSIWDAKGKKKVEKTDAIRDEIGRYYYDYTIPEDTVISVVEQWQYVFEAVTGTQKAIDRGYFTVCDKTITPNYCTVTNVELLMGERFTDESKITMQDIVKLIKQKEDYIDTFLHTTFLTKEIKGEIHYAMKGTGLFDFYFLPKFRPVIDVSKFEVRYWGKKWHDRTNETEFWQLDQDKIRIPRFTFLSYFGRRMFDVKIDYTYGYNSISAEICELCSKLVVVDLLQSEKYVHMLPSGLDSTLTISDQTAKFREDIAKILDKWRSSLLS